MNPLAGFSDWALALLPRMFLYPGGLAIIAAFLLALFMSRPVRTAVLHDALQLLARANIAALALAWATLSILPLPGVNPLPFPVDRFSLVAVTGISLLLDLVSRKERDADELWPSLAIVLALMSPVALQRGLVPGEPSQSIASYVTAAAVLAGLVGLFGSVRNGWSNAARWLAWWGATLALGVVPGDVWELVTLPAALVLGLVAQRLDWSRYATFLAYVLALAALATSLLLPPG